MGLIGLRFYVRMCKVLILQLYYFYVQGSTFPEYTYTAHYTYNKNLENKKI